MAFCRQRKVWGVGEAASVGGWVWWWGGRGLSHVTIRQRCGGTSSKHSSGSAWCGWSVDHVLMYLASVNCSAARQAMQGAGNCGQCRGRWSGCKEAGACLMRQADGAGGPSRRTAGNARCGEGVKQPALVGGSRHGAAGCCLARPADGAAGQPSLGIPQAAQSMWGEEVLGHESTKTLVHKKSVGVQGRGRCMGCLTLPCMLRCCRSTSSTLRPSPLSCSATPQ